MFSLIVKINLKKKCIGLPWFGRLRGPSIEYISPPRKNNARATAYIIKSYILFPVCIFAIDFRVEMK